MLENINFEKNRNKARYESVVNVESRETKETIDIMETPLFFRKDKSILAYLDFERHDSLRGSRATKKMLKGEKIELEDRMLFLESPFPYHKYFSTYNDDFGKEASSEFNHRLTSWANDEKLDLREYDKSLLHDLDRLLLALNKFSPLKIEKTDLAEFIKKTTELSHVFVNKGETERRNFVLSDKSQRQESARLINESLSSQKYRAMWLAFQKIILTAENSRDVPYLLRSTIGKEDYIGNSWGKRGGSFLINPNDQFIIEPNQSHGDFNLEFIATKSIPLSEVLGYLEYDDADKNESASYELYTKTASWLPKDESELPKIQSRLEQLFPFVDFDLNKIRDKAKESRESFNEALHSYIIQALSKYIRDKFDIDLEDKERHTKKELIEAVVKKMGIPIYGTNGDQLWPQPILYDDIHNRAKK